MIKMKRKKKDKREDKKDAKKQDKVKAGQEAPKAQAQPSIFGPAEPPPPIEGPGKAMVIFAHPDDAEFICSGTVAKWAAEGWHMIYVLLTSGDKGTHDVTMSREKLAAIREKEQRDACNALGVKECIFLGYPDGFTNVDDDLRGQIVRLLRIHRPDVVITWDGFRGSFNHRDHRYCGIAVADALYPAVRDRLYFEAHEADGLEQHQVNEVLLFGAADGDYEVDITDHWETKIDAILCHASQIGNRTKEDFLKMREEQRKRDGNDRMTERFRRWSIRRPARQQQEDEKKPEEDEGQEAGTTPEEPEFSAAQEDETVQIPVAEKV
jgi:LmbE family N-acetylglucosaminyl deacetylase